MVKIIFSIIFFINALWLWEKRRYSKKNSGSNVEPAKIDRKGFISFKI